VRVPGSVESVYLSVSDIEAAREDLLARGVEVSEVFHERALGARFHDLVVCPGRRLATVPMARSRPLAIQMATAGCSRRSRPGFPAAERSALMATTYESVEDLAEALRRAAAHGKHEERAGQADADWPDWYALYMVREHAGEELPI
jgi:hypothetical protein